MQPELTPGQISLYRRIMALAAGGRLFDPIVPIPVGPSDYVVYVRGPENLHIRHISDLDALCEAGLLTYRLSRMGTSKHYRLATQPRRAHARLDMEPLRDLGWRSRFVDATQALKATLALVLNGDALTEALVEVSYVQGVLNGVSAEIPPIHAAIAALTRLLTEAPPAAGVEALHDHSRALEQLGVWAGTIAHVLAVQAALPGPTTP